MPHEGISALSRIARRDFRIKVRQVHMRRSTRSKSRQPRVQMSRQPRVQMRTTASPNAQVLLRPLSSIADALLFRRLKHVRLLTKIDQKKKKRSRGPPRGPHTKVHEVQYGGPHMKVHSPGKSEYEPRFGKLFGRAKAAHDVASGGHYVASGGGGPSEYEPRFGKNFAARTPAHDVPSGGSAYCNRLCTGQFPYHIPIYLQNK